MKVSYTLDWLRFTVPFAPGDGVGLPFDWATRDFDAKSLTSYPSYNTAVKWKIGRCDWHSMRPEQRKMVTLTGDDLRDMRNAGTTDKELLEAVVRLEGLNVTRMDYAADVVLEGVRARAAYEAWQAKKLLSSARTVRVIKTHDSDEDGDPATTVYIGSRSSVKMVRFYDKGKQMELDYDWVRVELEAKKEVATKLAGEMVRLGVASAGNAAIKTLVTWDENWFIDLMTGAGEIDLEIGRKETDWENWIRTVVVPNFERAVKRDAGGSREALRSFFYRYRGLIEG